MCMCVCYNFCTVFSLCPCIRHQNQDDEHFKGPSCRSFVTTSSLSCASPYSSRPSLLATTNLFSIKIFFSLPKYYIHRVMQYKTFWDLLSSLSAITWRIQVICLSIACYFVLLNCIQWYRCTTGLRTSVQIPVFGY